jgi:hypothetical protein
VTMLACPSKVCTARNGTPASTASVAKVCRRVWMPRGTWALAQIGSNHSGRVWFVLMNVPL